MCVNVRSWQNTKLLQLEHDFAQRLRCEPPPADFGGSPPHEGENTVVDFADVNVPLVRGEPPKAAGVAHTGVFVQSHVLVVATSCFASSARSRTSRGSVRATRAVVSI